MDCVDLLDSDEEEAPTTPIPVVPDGIRILRHSTQIQSDDDANKQKQANKSVHHLRLLLEESKFLQNFDPEKSSREKRKLNRKNYSASNNKNSTMYDEKGRHRESGLNLCDCLDMSCAGCHFTCPTCGSTKCGPTCRVNRKWTYEQIEHDGKDLIVKNRLVIK